jgi:hypothetical protein
MSKIDSQVENDVVSLFQALAHPESISEAIPTLTEEQADQVRQLIYQGILTTALILDRAEGTTKRQDAANLPEDFVREVNEDLDALEAARSAMLTAQPGEEANTVPIFN